MLQGLDDVTAGNFALPLDVGNFDQTGLPTDAEIDTAIEQDNYQVGEWAEPDAIVEAADAKLAVIVADPADYELVENAGVWAYLNTGNFALNGQATNLLVNAAHDLGDSRHQTADATGVPAGSNAYIHIYGDNTLYAFSVDGDHRDYPKVTVLGEGAVNAGRHEF